MQLIEPHEGIWTWEPGALPSVKRAVIVEPGHIGLGTSVEILCGIVINLGKLPKISVIQTQ